MPGWYHADRRWPSDHPLESSRQYADKLPGCLLSIIELVGRDRWSEDRCVLLSGVCDLRPVTLPQFSCLPIRRVATFREQAVQQRRLRREACRRHRHSMGRWNLRYRSNAGALPIPILLFRRGLGHTNFLGRQISTQ